MDNRFLRCVVEHKASLRKEPEADNRFFLCVAEERKECTVKPELSMDNRFCRLVAEERGFVSSPLPTPPNRVYYSPNPPSLPTPTPTPPSPPTSTTPIRIYYTTKEVKPSERSEPSESFEERYKKKYGIVTRKRQKSELSIASEESFPSLPSAKSTPASPVLGSWATALRKNMEEDGILRKPKPRVVHAREEGEEGEEEIVFDADGFPHIRIKV
jgi:hypothetical protein